MPTERVKPIHLFVPFAEDAEIIERADGTVVARGHAFVNEIVNGEGGIRLKASAMQAATDDYLKFGAIREMHQPRAAGTCSLVRWDGNHCYMEAEIVDRDAREKVLKKVYKGLSVGVRPKLMRGKDVEQCEWIETSLVDRPKDPDALLIFQVDGFDPDAEVECEVVAADDGERATLASERASEKDGDGAEPESESSLFARSLAPSLPRSEPEAQVVQEPQRVADPAAVWEIVRAELPADATEDARRAALVGALVDLGTPVADAAMLAGTLPDDALTLPEPVEPDAVERAISTETPSLPVRENLEGPPAAVIERYIKEEDGKWCVYSESGRKLGEHDTKAEAVKQLAAIEASKHASSERANLASERASEGDGDHKYRFGAANGRFVLMRMRDGSLAIKDGETGTLEPCESREAAQARLAELDRVELVPDPTPEAQGAGPNADTQEATPNTEDVERAEEPEPDTLTRAEHEAEVTRLADSLSTAITRAEAAETHLVEARSNIERLETALATAEARARELAAMPAPSAPVMRYPHALDRPSMARLGQDADAETAALTKAYHAAEAAAKGETDQGRRGAFVDRMMHLQSLLAERGVAV